MPEINVNDIVLVYDEKVLRIAKTNTMLKRSVNKLFIVDKARRQKFRREAAVVGEQKRKYEF